MTTINKENDITVIIATHNRAQMLRQTLESMSQLNKDNIGVEFVLVDNNSSDNTKQIVESFSSRISINYLFESRPGKNCALNKAINEAPLGKLVVFTDDDITPKQDWLQQITVISKRLSDFSVFGGRIYAIWPKDKKPIWAKDTMIQMLGFGVHDYGNDEHVYTTGEYPFGANFWVRREIFSSGLNYDESFEWHPQNMIMGTETVFLKHLAAEGYGMIYCPAAVVGHRIRQKQLSIKYLLIRAYQFGRGKARLEPLCRADLFDKHPKVWHLMRLGSIARLILLFIVSLIPLIFCRPKKSLCAITWIGYNIESLRMTAER